jgi:transcriptional regulator of arginine metabolism
MTTPKQDRQATILEVVQTHSVESQEELRRLLRQRGWDVTQATLSRDLRELRLARVPSPDGPRYTVSATQTPGAGGGPGALATLLPQLVTGIDGVGEMIVVRTVIGGAQPVALALDRESWPEVLGTLGGDDTIFLVCRSASARERTMRRLKEISGK